MLHDVVKPPGRDRGRSAQLTLDDWERDQEADRKVAIVSAEPEVHGFDDVSALAEQLATRLAAELGPSVPPVPGAPSTARLVTLDQLVAELPRAKRPETWKRWLYERTRRGEVPGCVKLGGMLFFERESALAWLRAGAVTS
jgi:hypothetical protein